MRATDFLPFVDTGGVIGPAAFTFWLRAVYAADQRRQRAEVGDERQRASRFGPREHPSRAPRAEGCAEEDV